MANVGKSKAFLQVVVSDAPPGSIIDTYYTISINYSDPIKNNKRVRKISAKAYIPLLPVETAGSFCHSVSGNSQGTFRIAFPAEFLICWLASSRRGH